MQKFVFVPFIYDKKNMVITLILYFISIILLVLGSLFYTGILLKSDTSLICSYLMLPLGSLLFAYTFFVTTEFFIIKNKKLILFKNLHFKVINIENKDCLITCINDRYASSIKVLLIDNIKIDLCYKVYDVKKIKDLIDILQANNCKVMINDTDIEKCIKL